MNEGKQEKVDEMKSKIISFIKKIWYEEILEICGITKPRR